MQGAESRSDGHSDLCRGSRSRLHRDALLALYSLYKQASGGYVTDERAGALDMVGRAKYDAWAQRRGTGRDDAMRRYVALFEELPQRETKAA